MAKIRATCYRSGTGTAVSLAMSSIYHGPLFDLNLVFPKDHKWYFDPTVSQDEQNVKAFPVVAGSPSHYNVIKDLLFRPLTLVQGDTMWFIMRMLSLISSTVNKCVSSRAREITRGHNMRHHYEVVLGAIGRMNLLSQQQTYDDDDDDDSNPNVTSCGSRGVRVGRDGYQIITIEDFLGDSSDDDDNYDDDGIVVVMVGKLLLFTLLFLNIYNHIYNRFPQLMFHSFLFFVPFCFYIYDRIINSGNNDDDNDAFDPAANWIRRVNEKEADAVYFILRLYDGSIEEDIVRSIIEKHENANSQAGLASLKKKLKSVGQIINLSPSSVLLLYKHSVGGSSIRIGW